MRIVLLTSSGPKYDYLASRLAERFVLAALVRQVPAEPDPATPAGRAARYRSLRRRLTGQSRYRRRYFATERVPEPTLSVGDINDPRVARLLERTDFDLTVVCGTSLIRPPVLDALGCALNLHAGYLPWYKGNHTVFFAYRDRAWDRLGSSVHLLDRRLDGGAVIARVRPRMAPRDGVEQLYCRACSAGIEVLVEVLSRLRSAAAPVWAAPQDEPGRMFRNADRRLRIDLAVGLARLTRAGRPPRAEQVVHWSSPADGALDVRSLLAGNAAPPAHGPS